MPFRTSMLLSVLSAAADTPPWSGWRGLVSDLATDAAAGTGGSAGPGGQAGPAVAGARPITGAAVSLAGVDRAAAPTPALEPSRPAGARPSLLRAGGP